ncbi:MAG TPA: HAD family hydrolase, partial [Thermoplasmatales archaeon]|nr:HAD family hydrolase [Thermoplasmatales archaeon]HEX17006.1 HAD family hydrolase [Thermoplasmatales archaeon]
MGKAKFVIDLDGVIYRNNKLLPHAKDLIELLSERGIDFILATNNSTKTREMFANKLRG